MSGYLQNLLEGALDIAGDYVRTGVRVSIKTNLGPEIPVYSGDAGSSSGGASIAKLLGLRAGVIVRDARGGEIARLGDVAPTEPLKAVLAALVAAGLVFVIVRGVTR